RSAVVDFRHSAAQLIHVGFCWNGETVRLEGRDPPVQDIHVTQSSHATPPATPDEVGKQVSGQRSHPDRAQGQPPVTNDVKYRHCCPFAAARAASMTARRFSSASADSPKASAKYTDTVRMK